MKTINKLFILLVLISLTSCQGIYFNDFYEGNFAYAGEKIELKASSGIYLEHFKMAVMSISEDFYSINDPHNVVQNIYNSRYYYLSISLKFSNNESYVNPSFSYYDNDNRKNDSYVFLLNLQDPINPSYGLAFSLIPGEDIYYIELISKNNETTLQESWRISFNLDDASIKTGGSI
jgi:hypothetical protein